jgi:hypothetical protein
MAVLHPKSSSPDNLELIARKVTNSRLKNGTLLVEAGNEKQAGVLLKATLLGSHPEHVGRHAPPPPIGPTSLTHGHLLRGKPAPVCTHCGGPLAVARVSVDCLRYAEARRIYRLGGVISRHTRR